jgi:hypothetical protein
MPREGFEAEFRKHLAEARDEKSEVAVDFLKPDGDVIRCDCFLHRKMAAPLSRMHRAAARKTSGKISSAWFRAFFP